MRKTQRAGIVLSDSFLIVWLIILIVLIGCGVVVKVYANAAAAPVGNPVVTVTGVIPGAYVQLLVSNLPANVEFAVTMGPAGSQGINSELIAHFISPTGGTELYWFEIGSQERELARADVRIDSGSGYSAWAAFDSTQPLTVAAVTAVPTAMPTAAPAALPDKALPPVQVVHVQKGGLIVAQITGIPLNQHYTVTVGKAGTAGFGGFVVAGLATEDRNSRLAYFEIPLPLAAETRLDLCLEGNNTSYVVTFSNQDY